MEFFRQRQEGPDKHFRILDMTFGSGGHTCYILDQFRRSGVQGSIVVYASDCDPESYNLARRIMSERNYGVKELVPIRSNFRNLEEQLIQKGVEPGTLSGILIDTGISTIQWANQQRGFCHLRDGTLDLRLDPFQNSPKGYEVLQNIEEDALVKLLRTYGSLKAARHIASAILATKYLKIDGILAVIAHNDAEKKVVQRCLKQISLDDLEDQNEMLSTQVILCRVSYIDPRNINIDKDNNEMGLSYEEIEEIQNQNPWKMIKGEPLPLPVAEQILYPRFKNAVLFAAQRV